MNTTLSNVALGLALAFLAGFATHFLYKRWSTPGGELPTAEFSQNVSPEVGHEPRKHALTFVPQETGAVPRVELPLLQARDIEKLRGITGSQARIRGRVYRVGRASKSNTYFIDFGPSREALTAVIFASAVESFEQRKLPPKDFEGKEIEIQGVVKDHPQYGLEVILENPAQVKIVN